MGTRLERQRARDEFDVAPLDVSNDHNAHLQRDRKYAYRFQERARGKKGGGWGGSKGVKTGYAGQQPRDTWIFK